MSNRSNTLLGVALASVLVSFIAMMVIMWRIGFFTFNGTDPSSKVVAAALALVGAFTGTVVSMVGILLKHSIDQQAEARQRMESDRNAVLESETERRLQIESDRNTALQRDAEQRLKLEAAVRALQLFSTNTGAPTPSIQRDGALFALDSLGQYELTLLIASSLLEKGELSPATAATLLDHAIRYGNAGVQQTAIFQLHNNAARMISPIGLELPTCLLEWTDDLSDYVREWAVTAIAKILLARLPQEWMNKFENGLTVIVAVLCMAWQNEHVPRLKTDVGLILKEIFKTLPDFGVVYHTRGEIDTKRIRQEVLGVSDASGSTDTMDVVRQLARWNQDAALAAGVSSH